MKRTSKPPPLPNKRPPESARDLGTALPKHVSPFRLPTAPQPPIEPEPGPGAEGAEPVTLEVSPEDLRKAHEHAGAVRGPSPTIPLTPAIDWEPIGPPTPPQHPPPARVPPPAHFESSLREQIMSGITVPPTSRPSGAGPASGPAAGPSNPAGPNSQAPGYPVPTPIPYPSPLTPRAGSQARLSAAPAVSKPPSATHSAALTDAWASAPSTSSGGSQASSPSRSKVIERRDSMPIGYVVASAFFLAIAVVGFGLYLAFEVISL